MSSCETVEKMYKALFNEPKNNIQPRRKQWYKRTMKPIKTTNNE